MPTIQQQLKKVSKNLVSLSKQVDRLTKQVAKLQTAKKSPAKKKKAPAKKKAVAKKRAPAKRKAVKKTVKRTRATKSVTVLDSVFNAIKRSRTGIPIAKLQEKTKLESRQLSNALYKLSKKGLIKAKSRGVYIKK